jgi:hypothetical protein
MQFASFPGRCSTSRTGHGPYLCRGEFLGFHQNSMQRSKREKCSIMLIFSAVVARQVPYGSASFSTNVSKSEHLG